MVYLVYLLQTVDEPFPPGDEDPPDGGDGEDESNEALR